MLQYITLFWSTALLLLIPNANLQSGQSPTLPSDDPDKIQVALLLDTSNSMDGLIEQAKSQIWKMVNELAESKKDGKTPNIEIALYEYGNDNLSMSKGYIRQVTYLTSDLDLVSEKLFELKTKGGEEYCGYVIKEATNSLEWTDSDKDLKIIVIAGNEPFDQGPVDYKTSCENAVKKNIIINSIHCGDYKIGIREHWKEGADLTNGQYMNINTDDEVVHIPTPYDDTIIGLNKSLNKTYIGFGKKRGQLNNRQSEQDLNALSYGAANLRSRASFKSKSNYNNAEWDLVDAQSDNEEILEKIEEEDLPKEMQSMSIEERKAYVSEKSKEREIIKQQILDFDKKAEMYILEKRKTQDTDTQTLDNVLIQTVKEQAIKKGFVFN